jgi:hypothetical protein
MQIFIVAAPPNLDGPRYIPEYATEPALATRAHIPPGKDRLVELAINIASFAGERSGGEGFTPWLARRDPF